MSHHGTPSLPTVADLVTRAGDGELLAWHALFHRFRDELARECIGRIPRDLRSRFDPDDVIQAAFLSAFEHIREFEYRGDGSFRAWLRRILDNALRDGIKHHCRTKRTPSLENSSELELSERLTARRCDGPEEVAGTVEDQQRLRRALRNLPVELRAVIELRTERGWTFGRIATELECSPTTVRRRVQTAIEQILDELHSTAD